MAEHETIGHVAVIGAGTMGAGIAAQAANAGASVLLLDLPAAADARNATAEAAMARMLAADPGPFMHRDAAALVRAGNTEDDLYRLAECDWIIEAIVERLDAKQALYRRIDAVRRPGSVVSSNTSTIALVRLIDGLPERFGRDFVITHFFNPPRQMRLLELVTGPLTDPGQAARVRRFVDVAMGKTVVDCHDSPGFIANRIGAYWMLLGLAEAVAQGVPVELADAVMGKPLGIPGTGVFGLMDLIGLDVMADIAASLAAALLPGDAFHAVHEIATPLLRRLVAEGRTGRKGGGGFYRFDRASGRGKEVLDLGSLAYRPASTDVSAPPGDYAGAVMGGTLAYAAGLVPEATDSIEAVDTAMRLGYNWQSGPFEMLDRGLVALPVPSSGGPFYRTEGGRRQARGIGGGYRDIERAGGVVSLADIRLATAPVLREKAGVLWDIGEGVACLEATTKMGTFDPDLFALLHRAVETVAGNFRALVLCHDGSHFSAGANLTLVLSAARAGDWPAVAALVEGGQRAFKALKYAAFPVVAAPFGLALGGGCEIVLNSDAVQAHAELSIGLVECNVGLIPGWGGCGEFLARIPDVERAFDTIRAATTSTSAAHARALGYLRVTDGITMNRDRLLADAKARALALAEGYRAPAPPSFAPYAGALLDRLPEGATDHDRTIAEALAAVLAGGGSEVDMLAREAEHFLRLARTEKTQARIAHVLETGKPLRN